MHIIEWLSKLLQGIAEALQQKLKRHVAFYTKYFQTPLVEKDIATYLVNQESRGIPAIFSFALVKGPVFSLSEWLEAQKQDHEYGGVQN